MSIAPGHMDPVPMVHEHRQSPFPSMSSLQQQPPFHTTRLRVSVQDPERPWLVQMMCPVCRHMFTYDRKQHGPLPLIGSCPNAQCGSCFCSGCGDTCPKGIHHSAEHDGTQGPERDCRQLYHMHWNEDGGDFAALYEQLDTIYRRNTMSIISTSKDHDQHRLALVGAHHHHGSEKMLLTLSDMTQPQQAISLLLASQSHMTPTERRLVALAQRHHLLDMWQQRLSNGYAKPLLTLPPADMTTSEHASDIMTTSNSSDSVVRSMAQNALKMLGWM